MINNLKIKKLPFISTKSKTLDLYNKKLTKLDVSKETDLTWLVCFHNQLKELNLANNKKLKWLWCDKNQLKELDLTNNKKLKELSCLNNPNLKIIKISKGQKINIEKDNHTLIKEV